MYVFQSPMMERTSFFGVSSSLHRTILLQLKNWCFWTVVLEKTLESPLGSKEIQPVHPKGNQSWIIGWTDAEAPILWPPGAKNWLIRKDPDAGKDWRWEQKGLTEDVMVGWHHQLDGHEFEPALGVGDGQGGLACCSPWGCRVRHDWVTELMNWTDLPCFFVSFATSVKIFKPFQRTSSLFHWFSLLFSRFYFY